MSCGQPPSLFITENTVVLLILILIYLRTTIIVSQAIKVTYVVDRKPSYSFITEE